MKHLKTFESQSELPHRDDYILMKSYDYNNDLYNFITNTVGQVMFNTDKNSIVLVRYDDIPKNILHMFRKTYYRGTLEHYLDFPMRNIIFFSKNKKDVDVEMFNDMKKYNL